MKRYYLAEVKCYKYEKESVVFSIGADKRVKSVRNVTDLVWVGRIVMYGVPLSYLASQLYYWVMECV